MMEQFTMLNDQSRSSPRLLACQNVALYNQCLSSQSDETVNTAARFPRRRQSYFDSASCTATPTYSLPPTQSPPVLSYVDLIKSRIIAAVQERCKACSFALNQHQTLTLQNKPTQQTQLFHSAPLHLSYTHRYWTATHTHWHAHAHKHKNIQTHLYESKRQSKRRKVVSLVFNMNLGNPSQNVTVVGFLTWLWMFFNMLS